MLTKGTKPDAKSESKHNMFAFNDIPIPSTQKKNVIRIGLQFVPNGKLFNMEILWK